MNYITTNIRIPEADYLRLKAEAAQRRTSLSSVIRHKISTSFTPRRSKTEVKRMIDELKKLAKENAKATQGIDGTQVIREMRDQAKW